MFLLIKQPFDKLNYDGYKICTQHLEHFLCLCRDSFVAGTNYDV